MKTTTIIIFAICCTFSYKPSFCQIPYSDLSIKEHYDEVYNSYLKYNIIPEPIYEEPGSNMFAVYESLLDMYETTKDKAYLYKFMDKAIEIQNSKLGFYWYIQGDLDYMFPFNGRIAMILAHYSFIVYSDPQLYNTSIYNSSDYNGFSTFGSFAGWLFNSADITLNAALSDNSIWLGENFGFSQADCNIGALNYQSPWACALLYTYLASYYLHSNGLGTKTEYGIKTIQIVRLFFKENNIQYSSRFNAQYG